jgi:hypothetical protein
MKTTCNNIQAILDNPESNSMLELSDENANSYRQAITIPRDNNGIVDVRALRSLLLSTMRDVHRRREAGELEFVQIS